METTLGREPLLSASLILGVFISFTLLCGNKRLTVSGDCQSKGSSQSRVCRMSPPRCVTLCRQPPTLDLIFTMGGMETVGVLG